MSTLEGGGTSRHQRSFTSDLMVGNFVIHMFAFWHGCSFGFLFVCVIISSCVFFVYMFVFFCFLLFSIFMFSNLYSLLVC